MYKTHFVYFRLAAVLVTLVIGFTTKAQAHAFLDHADPKVGSTIDSCPTVLKVWFTEEIESAFSKVHVMDASGKIVSKDDAHVDSTNHSLLIVSLPQLPPGSYRVMWQVVAKDTHHTQGTFTFVVK